ncbi:MAG: hypothetical protein KAS71_04150, partial [Bacteroidales bacterium]|nr:hypothetical protein [Bacteroidales bacterium]
MRHLITFCLFAFIFSLSGAQVFPENAWGVYTWAGYNSREVTPAKTPLVKGGPIILKWSKIEPENGKFEFETQLGANLEQLYNDGYYTTVMIWVAPATTEVTETDTVWNNTPKWLFHEGGVPLVAFPARLDPLGKESTKYFPYYLHENYKFYFHRMIEEFGNYIKGLPAHLRERILFLQSAEGSTGDGQGYKGDPIDPQYNITQDQWSAFRIETWEKYVEAFSKDGELLIPLLTNYDSNREEQYNWMLNNLPKAAGLKNGMFSHGYHISDAQERLVSFNNFRDAVEAQGKVFFSRGEMDAEYKTYGWSTQNIPQALYWSGIYAAHCGLNLWNVPTDACQDAKNKDAQLFFNHYATQERPELAQRAFCALRRGLDASDTQTFPVSIYGSAEKSNTQRYINIANAFSSYGAKMGDPEKATGGGMINRKRQDYNDAGWKILTGNYQQHLSQINPEETSIGLWHVDKSVYGRFARSFEHASGRDTMYFQLHKDMFDGSADTVTFIVRYLDKENGSTWSFAYDAGEAALNTAYSITCNGSGTWKTQTVTVPDAVLNRNGPLGADIALINTDGKDDIFHMIEVEKGVAFPISKKKNNALLKSITWPDIPDSISTDFNWTGKVIPGFDSGTYSYEIQLPQEYQQIPALLAETEDVNATISSVMATNLTGGFDPRTSKFIVTAEDGKTKLTYSITFSLSASGNSEDKQPFVAEPLFTRFVYREWFNNNYIEISNPGTEDLDLSQYLVAIGVSSTPEQIITDTLTYDMRYNYYVPGRDYSSDDSLLYVPGIVVEDTEVNPVIELGGSFVIGHIENAEMEENSHLNDCDIIINRELSFDTEVKLIVPGPNTIMKNAWFTGALCLYKILNDSVRNGSKEISDPADFQLIDVFGTYDGSDWAPDGASLLAEDNQWNITRKPEFWEGDTLPGFSGSWGATEEASEWICVNRD